MKKNLILLLIISSMVAVSAMGNVESDTDETVLEGVEVLDTDEVITADETLTDEIAAEETDYVMVTGSLEIVEGEEVKLLSDNTIYTINTSLEDLEVLELENGQVVTLKGILEESEEQLDENSQQQSLIVTAIILGENEITINNENVTGNE